jgi:SNF2 family DNA or RNA helicase
LWRLAHTACFSLLESKLPPSLHRKTHISHPFFLQLAQYDIVLTTYAIVSMEVPKQPLPESEGGASNGLEKAKEKPPKGKGKKKAKPLGEDEGLLPPGSGPLARVAWFRVVLDEAQSIKNARTQSARAAWSLRAKRRWCLSGTPIQVRSRRGFLGQGRC